MLKNVSLSFSDAVNVRVYEYGIKNCEREKLLGVKFDNELIFEKHITGICGKASTKIYALARIAPHMDLSKRRMVMNAFFSICSSTIVYRSGCVTITRQTEK